MKRKVPSHNEVMAGLKIWRAVEPIIYRHTVNGGHRWGNSMVKVYWCRFKFADSLEVGDPVECVARYVYDGKVSFHPTRKLTDVERVLYESLVDG